MKQKKFSSVIGVDCLNKNRLQKFCTIYPDGGVTSHEGGEAGEGGPSSRASWCVDSTRALRGDDRVQVWARFGPGHRLVSVWCCGRGTPLPGVVIGGVAHVVVDEGVLGQGFLVVRVRGLRMEQKDSVKGGKGAGEGGPFGNRGTPINHPRWGWSAGHLPGSPG